VKAFVVAVIGMLFITGAHAQDDVVPDSPAFAADGITRVTTYLRTTVALSEDGGLDKASEARRALYALAESECAVLTEAFKAECRLSALSVGHVPFGKGPGKGTMSATAFDRLRKAPPEAARRPKR
jgi:hypothetical protein